MQLHAKDFSEPWYEYLIKKRKNAGINYVNDLNALIEFSNILDDVYENIDDYNPSRKNNFESFLMTWKVIKEYSSKQKNSLLGLKD